MSLLSVNIAKVKPLKLSQVKLQPTEIKEPITSSPEIQKPPTQEQIAYSKLLAVNPALEEMVRSLDLETFRGEKVGGDSSKLTAIAKKLIKPEESFTQEQIVARLQEQTQVSQERAERGFFLMVEAGVLEQTLTGLYYLGGSTPF